MNSQSFFITKEGQAARCEICHQADRLHYHDGHCERCQVVIADGLVVSSQPEWKPLWLELSEQLTPLQVTLVLLLLGIVSGLWLDITRLRLEQSALLAILVSLPASLPLLYWPNQRLHPILTGLLFTLLIAPAGWLLLACLYWLTHSSF